VAQQSSIATSVHFATFDLDLQSGELRKNGLKIRLPRQSFQVLSRLLQRPGEPVTREQLRETLWPDGTFVDFEVGLSSAVRKLRDALGDSADNPRFVETLPRVGYRFIASVNGSSDIDRATTVVPSMTADALPAVDSSTIARDSARLSIRARTAIAIVLVGGGVIAAALFIAATRNRSPSSPTPTAIGSIAVLPLRNLTGDAAQDYLADGITDALTTTLAERTVLRVTPRASTVDYKATNKSLRAIASELNVDAILQGTVVRSGDRVRVNVQLVDTHGQQILWARPFDGRLGDVVTLQDSVAQAIVQTALSTLSNRQSTQRVSTRAEDLFFRAISAAGRDNFQGFTEAIKYADAATDEQPDFARAWARKAHWWTQFSFGGGLPPSDFMPKAEAAARKALELDESLPEAHLALALVLYRFHWNWNEAEREFRRSLQLDSSSPGHRMLAAFLDAGGHPKEAVEEAQRARDLDPLSAQAHLSLGVVYRDAGRKEQAISEFRSVLRDHPEMARAHFHLALSLLEKDDANSAVSELRTAVSLSPRAPVYLAYLGYTHALGGNTGEAQRILGELERLSRQQFVSPVDLAGIEVSLGLKDAALVSLEKACDVRDPALTTLLTDRRMVSLRSDSRFQNLLRRVGLAPELRPGTDAGELSTNASPATRHSAISTARLRLRHVRP
jgi:TolB-like protein/DNA-binding winged helix-turn-helix (wHTH) protein/Flp pilus assembly protein TadD